MSQLFHPIFISIIFFLTLTFTSSYVIIIPKSTRLPTQGKRFPIRTYMFDSILANGAFSQVSSQWSTAGYYVLNRIQSALHRVPVEIEISAVASQLIVLIIFLLMSGIIGVNDDLVSSPYDDRSTVYNIQKSNQFYAKKPLFVLRRLLKISFLAGGFAINLFLDWRFGNLKKNEQQRAKQALQLATQMGPTFIKLGQALSIRTDLVSEAYTSELKKLQDAVPPFDSVQAKEIICRELRIDNVRQKFKTISELPIASASIGQVYKATLFDDRQVAVKVQRPNILSDISLDLYVLRLTANFLLNVVNKLKPSDKSEQSEIEFSLSFVDEWGKGLVAEVDYRLEAKNTKQFILAMEKRGLNAVMSPAVVEELSGGKILVTQWVDGTRLDRDASADVPRLCGVAVNAYLTMLLDTGVLHCDPHPGNLLRTTDGRLCILDWGMTLGLPNDLQYALLEFISHVNAEAYDALPEDFVKLGFTPPDKVQQVRDSGLTEGFEFAFRQLTKGGGPNKMRDRIKEELIERYGGGDLTNDEIRTRAQQEMVQKMEQMLVNEGVDVNGITNLMEVVSKRNRDIFKFPPYMLYVTRAFATLEGIGLSINEDYSILQECYPYLAKRLMSDDSPRSRRAMKNMLLSGGVLSPQKLIEMSDGFTSYTASTVNSDRDGTGVRLAQDAFTDLLMDEQGNLMQEIVLEGAANVTDSLVREGYYRLKESTGGKLIRGALKTPKELVDIFVPDELKFFALPLTLPLTLPYDITHAVSNLIAKDESDSETIRALQNLWVALEPRIVNFMQEKNANNASNVAAPSTITVQEAINALLTADPKFVRNAITQSNLRMVPGLATLTRRYGAELMYRTSERFKSKKMLGSKQLISSSEFADSARVKTPDSEHQSDKDVDALDGEERLHVQLLISVLSSLTSASAKSFAKVLDDRVKKA